MVVGVDSSSENLNLAQKIIANHPQDNLNFHLGKVEDVISNMNLEKSCLILDPPRAGLHAEVRGALKGSMAQQILYVSCHPATLARDLKELTETQFEIESIQGLDMFPHTPHLETVVALRNNLS